MLDDTDDLQYVVARALTDLTGSPDWDHKAADAVAERYGPEAAAAPQALLAHLDEGYVQRLLAQAEVKHGGPGPHDSGTPQAIHGSWAERLGRLIGLPEDLIDTDRDGPGRIPFGHPDANVAEGPDAFTGMITDFLPEPDPVTFDASWMQEALEDEKHPLNDIASKAAYLLWISRGDEIEDLDVVDEGFEDLYSAFDEFNDEMVEIAGDHDLPEDFWRDPDLFDNLTDRDVHDDVDNRLASAADAVHSAYIDFAAGFHESAVYEAESSTRYDKDAGARWAAGSGYTVDKLPYDKWDDSDSLVRSDAAARELKHATALGLAKDLTEGEGILLRDGYRARTGRAGHGPAYEGASAAIGAWAQSANDEHAPSLLAQQAAADGFGLHTYSPWHTKPEDATGYGDFARYEDETFLAQQSMLQSMYDRTQQHFSDMGITHLRLHRGQSEWDGTDRPMASWSMSDDTARGFASGLSPYEVDEDFHHAQVAPNQSVLRHKTVPVEQVLCFPGTGYGCLNEYEVVVLANPPHEEATPEGQLRFEGAEEWKHAGPGPHPGTGSPQAVHSVGGGLGPAMKRLTEMLADPDWRFVRRYSNTPQAAHGAEEIVRAQDLQEQGKTFEVLAQAETEAYREFFDRPDTPNVRVDRVQVRVGDVDGHPDAGVWEDRIHIWPDPEGTRVARLPANGRTHYGLHAIWDDEKGEVAGWSINDPYTYDTEFETNPVEIERTKHRLDTNEKYVDLHTIPRDIDFTGSVRKIADFEPETDEEAQAKQNLLRLAGRVQRGDKVYSQPLFDGDHALSGLEHALALSEEPPKENTELDELLGITTGRQEAIRKAKFQFVEAGRKADSLVVGGVGDVEVDPSKPTIKQEGILSSSGLKAHVAEQIAEDMDGETARSLDQYGTYFFGTRDDPEHGVDSKEGREKIASDLVGNWAASSNDENFQGLVMQDAARDEFDLTGTSDWHTDGRVGEEHVTDVEALQDGQQMVLRQMYERTQKMFEDAGITEVRVHRGQSARAGDEDFALRPLSSWSVQESTASGFAADSLGQSATRKVDLDEGQTLASLTGRPGGLAPAPGTELGVVFSATVPASRVLCTPKTGLGCLGEYELVLLGGPLEDMVEPLGGETKHLPGQHPQESHGNWVRGPKIVSLGDLTDRLVRRMLADQKTETVRADFTEGNAAYERMKEFSDPEAMEEARKRAEQAWTKAVEGRITHKERDELSFAMKFGMIPVEVESLEGEERTPLPDGKVTYEVPLDPDDTLTRFMAQRKVPSMSERAMDGMDEQDARMSRAMLSDWARHPSQRGGRLLMDAAREEFDLQGAAPTEPLEGVTDDERRVARDLVRRLKAESEATFEPGEHLVLWRAVQDLDVREGEAYRTRPIESWSTEPDSAEFFAMVPEGEGTGIAMGESARILKATVPADRILLVGVPGAELQETLVIGEEMTPDRVFTAEDFEGFGMTRWEEKHMGPGPHPSGTPQAVHGSGIDTVRKVLDSLPEFTRMHTVTQIFDLTDDIRALSELAEADDAREATEGLGPMARMLVRSAGAWQRGDFPNLDEHEEEIARAYQTAGIEARRALDTIAEYGDEPLPHTRTALLSSRQKVLSRVMGSLGPDEDFPVHDDTPGPDLTDGFVVRNETSSASVLKKDVARQIAENLDDETGVKLLQYSGASPGMAKFEGWKEEVASAVVGNWAASSNDRNAQGLAMQKAAEAEFGLDGAASWQYAPQSQTNYGSDEIHDVDLLKEGQQTVLRQMYERTQAMFAEEGITHVRLFRGQRVEEGWNGKMRPLSSWSVTNRTATTFASGSGSDAHGASVLNVDLDVPVEDPEGLSALSNLREERGLVTRGTIPVSRILCTPKTGLGCLNESEMVVLGGPLEQMTQPLRETKHMGPGPHPSGTPQLVHRGGGVGYEAAVRHLSDLLLHDNDRTRTIAGRLFEKFTGGIGENDPAHGTLDLEWMGQFAPVKAGSDVDTTVGRARDYLRTLPTYDESDEAHEQAIMVRADGSIHGNHIKIGSARSIPMGPGSQYRDKDVAAVIHNHPRDNPLSIGDLMAAVNLQVGREEAVTRSGHYALVIDWDAVESPTSLRQDVVQVRKGIVDFAQAWVNEGRLSSEDQMRYGAGDAVARALSEKVDAVTYERTGTWGGDEEWPQELVDRLKQWITS